MKRHLEDKVDVKELGEFISAVSDAYDQSDVASTRYGDGLVGSAVSDGHHRDDN